MSYNDPASHAQQAPLWYEIYKAARKAEFQTQRHLEQQVSKLQLNFDVFLSQNGLVRNEFGRLLAQQEAVVGGLSPVGRFALFLQLMATQPISQDIAVLRVYGSEWAGALQFGLGELRRSFRQLRQRLSGLVDVCRQAGVLERLEDACAEIRGKLVADPEYEEACAVGDELHSLSEFFKSRAILVDRNRADRAAVEAYRATKTARTYCSHRDKVCQTNLRLSNSDAMDAQALEQSRQQATEQTAVIRELQHERSALQQQVQQLTESLEAAQKRLQVVQHESRLQQQREVLVLSRLRRQAQQLRQYATVNRVRLEAAAASSGEVAQLLMGVQQLDSD